MGKYDKGPRKSNREAELDVRLIICGVLNSETLPEPNER